MRPLSVKELGPLVELLSGGMAAIAHIVFFDIAGIPLVLLWLALGAIVTTLRLGFVNVRGLPHALKILTGSTEALVSPDAAAQSVAEESAASGQISSLQALATAVSATVGLGSIAGVAIALRLGGPGALFWMTLVGLLGMSLKFAEVTLGQKYRVILADGTPLGGPMYYLSRGLMERGLPTLGRWLAVIFSLFCIGGAIAGGGMFQVSQSYGAVRQVVGLPAWLYGWSLMMLVGWVTMGGARRIGQVAAKLVPIMGGVYGLGCAWVIGQHHDQLMTVLATVVQAAFYPPAAVGGVVGVIAVGLQRAAFTCEAGLGSAAIAHSASYNPIPVREGLVAMLEPLIDTGLICNLTGLVILLSGVLDDPALAALNGAELTSAAFASSLAWFPLVLAGIVLCFAFSTMVSWGYYGERCWGYLFGLERIGLYRTVFLGAIVVGAIATPTEVITFGDAMYIAMAVPNLCGIHLLLGRVKQDWISYQVQLRAGEALTLSAAQTEAETMDA